MRNTIIITIILLSGLKETKAVSVNGIPGLAGCYSFDKNGFDGSGRGHDATIVGATHSPAGGYDGAGAYQFDGIDDKIYADGLAVNTAPGGQNTVSFWMNWESGIAKSSMVFSWSGAYDLWMLRDYPSFGKRTLGFNTGAGNQVGISSTGLLGQWVHVTAIFFNGLPSITNEVLYINGVRQILSDQMHPSSNIGFATPYFQLSGWNFDNDNFNFKGQIDELRIYSRALTDEEISAIYTAGSTDKCSDAPPVADAGENVTVISAQVSSTVLNGMGTDPDQNDILQYRWLEGANVLQDWKACEAGGQCPLTLNGLSFPIGQHTLTLQVNDGNATVSDEMLLTVGNSAPVVSPNGGGTYEIGTPVSLGAEISDFDGDAIHYEWKIDDNAICSGDIISITGGSPVSITPCVLNGLALGDHQGEIEISDAINTVVKAQVQIKVVDNSMPTLAPISNASILWPPNHRMIDIVIDANSSDNSGSVTLSASVASNEPQYDPGAGDLSPDWDSLEIDQAKGTISVKLRAERSGRGIGRVYSIHISATDPSGNTAGSVVEIRVPHNQGRK